MSIRNLLIVGPTKSGKSTLANVLSDTNTFNENEYSTPAGKYQKPVFFEWSMMRKTGEIIYRVVDTSGIENHEKEAINEIAKLFPEGISQVLFVVQGFGKEDINMLELFTKVFGSDIYKYVTIVRTKFYNFKNNQECEKDKQMLREDERTAKIVESCTGIVHVNNDNQGTRT